MASSKTKPVASATLFVDPGLTDSQGNPCCFKYRSTAWGGHLIIPEFYGNLPEYCVFDSGAYKRFLSWLVGK